MVKVRITYHPDYTKTIYDEGARSGIIDLPTDTYWGMLIASFVIFGDDGINHILFEEVRNYERPNQSFIPVRFGYLAYALGNYILAYDSTYRPNRPRNDWTSYINSFQRHIQEIRPDDTADYTAHIIGKGEAMVKFKDTAFLNGVVAIMEWFGMNPKDYFFEFYQNGVEMDF